MKRNFTSLGVLIVLLSACVIERDSSIDEPETPKPRPIFRARENPNDRPSSKILPQCRPKKGRKLGQAECPKGFICVPALSNDRDGFCLQECGEKVEGFLKKNPSRCTDDLRCMRKKDAQMMTIGMFCMRPQHKRNEPCEAPFDEEACTNGLTCLPHSDKKDKSGSLCKEECSVERPCADKREQCLIPRYARHEPQGQDLTHKKNIFCEIDVCDRNLASCACDKTHGFYCHPLFEGSNTGRCVRSIGVCAS